MDGLKAVPFKERLVPAVGAAHDEQGGQDVVPGFGRQHNRVREHAAVPADVFVGAGWGSIFIAHPETCDSDDIHSSFWVADNAVTARLVVRTRAAYGAVVLRYVEVDGPGPQGVGHPA